jgi:hypothetical protein
MTLATRPLRVVLVWRGEPLEERVFQNPQQISIGTSKSCTFTIPPSRLGDAFPLFRPSADSAGYVLTLAPGMIGKLSLAGDPWAVSEFLDQGRGVRDGEWRQQPLGSADWGIIGLDDSGDVAFFFQFVAEGARVGPNPTWLDRFLGQALAFSAVVHIALLVLAFAFWEKDEQLDVDPPPSAAIAKVLLDKPPEPPPPEEKKPKQDPRKVREEDASKRAAGKEGTIGNPDAKNVKTVIAKGPRDQIVKKVTGLGLLGTLKAPNQNQALKSLLSDTPDANMTTALAGVKGATTVIGRGTGGSSTRGEGEGGGGTGNGQLYGVGNLAIGGGGHGSHNTGTGPGHVAKELKVAVTTGAPETGGGLSKEQILKVVQSHAAAIQFCYEKELQRFPHLAGKVVLKWKVDLDGHVQATGVESSSLGNPSAESCMVRQVKNWLFPKPNGIVCNVSFPFFFKGQ